MSDEVEFSFALFQIGAFGFAVDASQLVLVDDSSEDDVQPRWDVAELLGIGRAQSAQTEARRTATLRGDTAARIRLGSKVEITVAARSSLFSLPPLLEGLEGRGMLALLRHHDRLWIVLDLRQAART